MDPIKGVVKTMWTSLSDNSQTDANRKPPQSSPLLQHHTYSLRKDTDISTENASDGHLRLAEKRSLMKWPHSSTQKARIDPSDQDSPCLQPVHSDQIEEISDSDPEHDVPSPRNHRARPIHTTKSSSDSQENRLLRPDRSFHRDPNAVLIPDPMVLKKAQPGCFGKAGLRNHGPKPLNTLDSPSANKYVTRSAYLNQHLGRKPREELPEEPPRKRIKTENTTNEDELSPVSYSRSSTTSTQNLWKTTRATRVQPTSETLPNAAAHAPTQENARLGATQQVSKKNGEAQSRRKTQPLSSEPVTGVRSPYFSQINGNCSVQPDPRNQTADIPESISSSSSTGTSNSTSDSGTDRHSLKDSLNKRKAPGANERSPPRDAVRIAPTRDVPMRNSSTSSSPPLEQVEAQVPLQARAVSVPPESPDELQVDEVRYHRTQASSNQVLMSPLRQSRRKPPNSQVLGDLIQGNPSSSQLRSMNAHQKKQTSGLLQFDLQRIASSRLRSVRNSYYVFVIDTADKLVWINIQGTPFSNHPVMGPFKVAQIFEVMYSTGGQPLILIRLRLDHVKGRGQEHKMVLELDSEKSGFDLVRALQELDPSLTIKDKSGQWLQDAFKMEAKAAAGAAAANVSQSTPERSPDELAATSRISLMSERSKVERVRPKGVHVNTREALDPPKSKTLDPPKNTKTFTTGSDQLSQTPFDTRDSESPSREMPPVRTRNAPVDELNEQTQEQSRAMPRSTRLSRATKKRSPSPQKIKFSRTGGLGPPWKTPLVYPPDGKKQASVDFGSLSRLDDEEFLNDTIINFFMRYLQFQTEQTHPKFLKKMHFFNTYFLENLSKGAKRTGINYQSVEKWTKNIDLFSRDFVVVPVNEHLHWYLIIVCNLQWFKQPSKEEEGDDVGVTGTNDADLMGDNQATTETQQSFEDLSIEDSSPATTQKSVRSSRKKKKPALKKYDYQKPIIISLDSLGTPRSPTCGLIKQYIIEEGKARMNIDIDKESLPAMTAKLMPLQNNFSDCGLYVCMYLEQFIKQPYRFVQAVLQREADFGWPKDVCGSDLRERMRNLILELHRIQEKEEGQDEIPELGNILVQMREPKLEVVADSPSTEDDLEAEQSTRERRTASSRGPQQILPELLQVNHSKTLPAGRPSAQINAPCLFEEVSQPAKTPVGRAASMRRLSGAPVSYHAPERIDLTQDDDNRSTADPTQKRPRSPAHRSNSPQTHAESLNKPDRGAAQPKREDSVTTEYLQGYSPEAEGLPQWPPSPDADTQNFQVLGERSAGWKRSQESAEIRETPPEDDEVPQQELQADGRGRGRAAEDEILFL